MVHHSLGLKRHTVRLFDYDTRWSEAYVEVASEIDQALGDLVSDIQHVGSTAIPGLAAKPILDIAIAVPSPSAIPAVAARLVRLDYIDRGAGDGTIGYLLVRESMPDVRTVHAHVVERESDQWRSYLAFRAMLRRDDVTRNMYLELKRDLAEQFPNDRRSYTAGKTAFIRSVISKQEPWQTGSRRV